MKTKIFIWKSYGDIKVYDISTNEKYEALKWEVLGVLEYLGCNVNPTSGSIMDIIYEFGLGTHESFEYGTSIGELN